MITRIGRTESSYGSAKVAQHGRLGIAHLTLDCDLRFHVDTTEPRAKHGDGDSGHRKYWRKVHNGKELEEHGA